MHVEEGIRGYDWRSCACEKHSLEGEGEASCVADLAVNAGEVPAGRWRVAARAVEYLEMDYMRTVCSLENLALPLGNIRLQNRCLLGESSSSWALFSYVLSLPAHCFAIHATTVWCKTRRLLGSWQGNPIRSIWCLKRSRAGAIVVRLLDVARFSHWPFPVDIDVIGWALLIHVQHRSSDLMP